MLEIACFLRIPEIILKRIFLVQRDHANYTEFLCNYYCLEILVMFFLRSLGIMLKEFFITIYTNLKLLNKLEKQGGVA